MTRSMALVLAFVLATATLAAQGRRSGGSAAPAVPPPPPAPVIEPAMLNCPSILGHGVRTDRTYCDVAIGTDPEMGILVSLPPHVGPVTLLFDLHNRHVYSESAVKAGKAFSRYTADIGVLTLDNWIVSRAAIRSEFRTEADLFDRIAAGTGSTALKAVAPTGIQPIAVTIEEREQRVSILGEKLLVERIDGTDTFKTPGRAMAVISNVRVQYVPAPAAPVAPSPRR